MENSPAWPRSRSTERASTPKTSIWVTSPIQNGPATSGSAAAATARAAAPARRAGVTSRVLARDAAGPEEQQDRHRAEQDEVGELGQQPAPVGVEQAHDERADHRPAEAAEPAHDDDDQRHDEDLPLGAGIEGEEGAAHDARHAGHEGRERRHHREQAVDVDAGGGDLLAIVHAGADDGADLRARVEDPED